MIWRRITVVKYTEDALSKQDHYFVKEDPARIYRGIKDLLVEEFDMDRIEEGRNEFSVTGPKDKIRMHAFKEKSRNTVLYFSLSWRVKDPKNIYKQNRPDDIKKVRVKTTGKVITVYPGGNAEIWEPYPVTQYPQDNYGSTHLEDEKTQFQRSKFYRILVGIWYNKFYSKEIHKYEEEASEIVVRLQNLMREKFGVEDGIVRTGSSHYTPPWQ